MTDYWPDSAFQRPSKNPTIDDLMDPAVMAVHAREAMLESRRAGQKQADELMGAGWRFEIPSESATEPWQWFWRAPPKRANAQGRLYRSTQQAFNALKKTEPQQ